MNDEYRGKAAMAVFALANRTQSAGMKDAGTAKGAKWKPMPYNDHSRMDVERLREALVYFEIAESIHAPSVGGTYQRALLLESMGEWDAAIALFEAAGGPDDFSTRRCKEKRAGTYDELAFLGMSQSAIDAMDGFDADAFFAAEGGDADASSSVPDLDEATRQTMSQLALTFTHHLLDRNWAAARSLMHPDDALDEAAMRDDFEALFEGEDFPVSANVFEVHAGGEPGRIGWVYVSIDSENAEAVTVDIGPHGDRLVIRGVEFGRP